MDIEIEHCRFHIVRRGGWSWSPSSKEWMRAAVEVLPRLLMQRLVALLPQDTDMELREPLRLTIPLSLAQMPLRAWVPSAGQDDMAAAQVLLGERIEIAMQHALREAGVFGSAAQPTVHEPEPIAPPPAAAQPYAEVLLALLLDWQQRDQLAWQLRDLDVAVLRAWHRALAQCRQRARAAGRDRPALVDSAQLLRWIGVFPPATEAAAVSEAQQLRRRIQAMVSVAAHSALAPGAPVVHALLQQHLPLDIPASGYSLTGAAGAPAMARHASEGDYASAGQPQATVLACGEYAIESALPFLLLGPLSRAGYLQTLAASLAAAGLDALLPAFATALAYKVLPTPQRSWQRSAKTVRTAALFAGLAEPVEEAQLARLARQASAHLDACGRQLTQRIAVACDPPRRFLWLSQFHAQGQQHFLFEANDLFLVASGTDPQTLILLLSQQADALVLLPADAAHATVLQALDEQGLPFVTDAAPLRGEPWRRLAPARLWGNGPRGRDAQWIGLAADLPELAQRAQELIQALIFERPALTLHADLALERQLLLASGFSLGFIAWTLWQEREAIDPLLSLERFADLDGWLRVEPDHVDVRLPLGRRRFDLAAHGLLTQVPDVPWLQGRRLTFTGG